MKRRNHKVLFTIGLILLLAIILMVGLACERIAPIIIKNWTDMELSIFVQDVYIGDVAPWSEIRNERVLVYARFHIKAKNAQGEVVFYKNITIDEIKEIDWIVIIPPLQDGS
ncbi:hypothetical protein ACFLU4_05580 [Chloroflexota bacterium]